MLGSVNHSYAVLSLLQHFFFAMIYNLIRNLNKNNSNKFIHLSLCLISGLFGSENSCLKSIFHLCLEELARSLEGELGKELMEEEEMFTPLRFGSESHSGHFGLITTLTSGVFGSCLGDKKLAKNLLQGD